MTSSRLPSAVPHAHRTDVLARLDREWSALRHRPTALIRARSWQVGADFVDLDELIAATGFFASASERLSALTTPDAEHDAVLARLVLAAHHDDLAARIVLQRLLPGLVARARRWTWRIDGSGDAIDELVAAAWGVIRTFPEPRLCRHVAARLLRDSEHQAFVKHTRRLAEHVPTEPDRLDRPVVRLPDPEPILELAELVSDARGNALTDADLRLLQLLVSGLPMADVAAALDVSVRTVTNHRNAMVHRLRQVAFAA
jgi:DNA-directed RNA polymerase specialized sigma24 family protein